MLADIVKIHCLKHHADFPMSRTSRIVVCKEGSDEHTLSDNFPYSGPWIYCCNCQTFIAWEAALIDVSVKQCPFCLSSLNPRLYICDHCAVTMLDFDDQTLRKHHTVLNWGMPQPACPACHRFPGSTPKQHYCRTLQINLATARPTCPFCKVKTDETDGAMPINSNLNMALAEAEARACEAEERRRLAEEAARKEIELRVRAEAAYARAEAEARARAEAEQRAFAEAVERQEAEWRKARAEDRARQAEGRARAIEERHRQADAAVLKEGASREIIGTQARQMDDIFTINPAQPNAGIESGARRNNVAIALYAGIAVLLFIILIVILITLIRLL